MPSLPLLQSDTSCTVTVSVNTLSASSSQKFTYKASLSPIAYSVSPIRGGTGGGTLLTITGSKFP